VDFAARRLADRAGRLGGLCGREPIFKISHTNEFVGNRKVAHQPTGPCTPLKMGWWVYEKEGSEASRKEPVEEDRNRSSTTRLSKAVVEPDFYPGVRALRGPGRGLCIAFGEDVRVRPGTSPRCP
jgi:hypothetical protein